MAFLKFYFISLPIFVAMDLIWIGVIAKNFYKDQIGFLMTSEVRWGAAVLFYALYIFGLVFFAIMPSFREGDWIKALVSGALFGLICYATYDLTNLATLTGWPVKMVVYDLIWGACVSGFVSLISFWIGPKHI